MVFWDQMSLSCPLRFQQIDSRALPSCILPQPYCLLRCPLSQPGSVTFINSIASIKKRSCLLIQGKAKEPNRRGGKASVKCLSEHQKNISGLVRYEKKGVAMSL